jgi:hypothetical protein
MIVRIGFSRHRGFAPLSWAIMLVEGTPFSHAYLKFYSASMERWLVYEATGKGVFFKSLAIFDEHAETVEEYELPISEEHRVRLMRWAVDQSGKPYGRLQIVGILAMRVARKFGFTIRNLFTNGRTQFICDELVAEALVQAGYSVTRSEFDDMGLIELRSLVGDLALARI